MNGIGGTVGCYLHLGLLCPRRNRWVRYLQRFPKGSTYTPTVGDVVSVTGQWEPYHDIPEMGSFTTVTRPARPLPAPTVWTIPSLVNDFNSKQVIGKGIQEITRRVLDVFAE